MASQTNSSSHEFILTRRKFTSSSLWWHWLWPHGSFGWNPTEDVLSSCTMACTIDRGYAQHLFYGLHHITSVWVPFFHEAALETLRSAWMKGRKLQYWCSIGTPLTRSKDRHAYPIIQIFLYSTCLFESFKVSVMYSVSDNMSDIQLYYVLGGTVNYSISGQTLGNRQYSWVNRSLIQNAVSYFDNLKCGNTLMRFTLDNILINLLVHLIPNWSGWYS